MDVSHRTIVRPSVVLAIVFTAGAILFGVPAIVVMAMGNWVAFVIFGLIAVCHVSTAIYYWRRYLLGRRRQKQREESAKSAIKIEGK
jgi:membrane protein implicated in regulation of membrane protease activity